MNWIEEIVPCDTLFVRKDGDSCSMEVFTAVEIVEDLFRLQTVLLNGLSVGLGDSSFFISKELLFEQFEPYVFTIDSYQKEMRQTI